MRAELYYATGGAWASGSGDGRRPPRPAISPSVPPAPEQVGARSRRCNDRSEGHRAVGTADLRRARRTVEPSARASKARRVVPCHGDLELWLPISPGTHGTAARALGRAWLLGNVAVNQSHRSR